MAWREPNKETVPPLAEHFLVFLEEYGRGIPVLRIYKMFGVHANTVTRWRTRGDFREREAAIHKRHEDALAESKELPYTREMEKWLLAYEEVKDRTKACEESGISWGQIELGLQRCPAFARVYEYYVNRNLVVRAEDRLFEAAGQGHSKAVGDVLKMRGATKKGEKVTDLGDGRPTLGDVEEAKEWLANMTVQPEIEN